MYVRSMIYRKYVQVSTGVSLCRSDVDREDRTYCRDDYCFATQFNRSMLALKLLTMIAAEVASRRVRREEDLLCCCDQSPTVNVSFDRVRKAANTPALTESAQRRR